MTEPMSASESIVPAEPLPLEKITTAGPPAAEAGGILTIDLAAIEANWKALARRAMPSECAAVIKADGYGCGIEPVATMLAKAGCRTFFVADLLEARRVRAVAQEPTVYVLNGLMPGTAATYADLHVRPVIGSMTELAEWDAFVTANDWRGGAALHVDTGMNRLGITPGDAAALAPRIRSENHGITLLMSHFASSEAPDDQLNEKQIRLFREVRMLYRGIPASISNSSGVFLGSPAHCDLVRPGAALFGVNPTPGRNNPMRPVVELRGRVVGLRNIMRGETVGYNGQWTAKRATNIAVVGVGYADGYLRAASASDTVRGADVMVAGKRCTLAGRVSMDLIAIDVTDVPTPVKRGDMVTLIGDDITVDDFAAAAGTIGYEVLTSLGKRYHRIYRVG
jgi:alanine racemase